MGDSIPMMTEHSPPGLAFVARALHAEAETNALVEQLHSDGVAVMALKGPMVQQRLYGTPAAYPSGDVDLLVPRGDGPRARRVLERLGWRFEPENGVLWRLSRAATFERSGVRIDLHWGLHAAHLPAWTLRRLERSLWEGATRDPSGLFRPAAEPLLVFLAVHAAGHGFERAEWVRNVEACADLVRDWDAVWTIARRSRVEGVVRGVLSGTEPTRRVSLLDGPAGALLSGLTWVLRGHFLPPSIRQAARRTLTRLRPPSRRTFRGLDLEIASGVFPPQPVSEAVAERAMEALQGLSDPIAVDIGTGSGAIALALASSRPDAQVYATDVSRRALRCAGRNARRLGIRNVRLLRGALLEPLPGELRGRVAAVCTNVPYVPAGMAGTWGGDPRVVGPGDDGLGLVRELAEAARAFLAPHGVLVLQVADFQWSGFAAELQAMGYAPRDPDVGRPGRAVVASAVWRGGT